MNHASRILPPFYYLFHCWVMKSEAKPLCIFRTPRVCVGTFICFIKSLLMIDTYCTHLLSFEATNAKTFINCLAFWTSFVFPDLFFNALSNCLVALHGQLILNIWYFLFFLLKERLYCLYSELLLWLTEFFVFIVLVLMPVHICFWILTIKTPNHIR